MSIHKRCIRRTEIFLTMNFVSQMIFSLKSVLCIFKAMASSAYLPLFTRPYYKKWALLSFLKGTLFLFDFFLD